MKRGFSLIGVSDEIFYFSVVINPNVDKAYIHFDELPDGTWRLTYTKPTRIEMGKATCFSFQHEAVEGKQIGRMWMKLDGLDIEYDVAQRIAIGTSPSTRSIHFNQVKDNKWKVVFSYNLIPDIKKLESIWIHREDADVLYPAKFDDKDDQPGYVVTFRDIPEAITQGDDMKEAMYMAKDCLSTAFEFYFEDGREILPPSEPQEGEIMVKIDELDEALIAIHQQKLKKKQ